MKKDLMNACMISDIVSRLPPLIAHKWAELKITKKMEIKVLKNNLVIYFRFFRSISFSLHRQRLRRLNFVLLPAKHMLLSHLTIIRTTESHA